MSCELQSKQLPFRHGAFHTRPFLPLCILAKHAKSDQLLPPWVAKRLLEPFQPFIPLFFQQRHGGLSLAADSGVLFPVLPLACCNILDKSLTTVAEPSQKWGEAPAPLKANSLPPEAPPLSQPPRAGGGTQVPHNYQRGSYPNPTPAEGWSLGAVAQS